MQICWLTSEIHIADIGKSTFTYIQSIKNKITNELLVEAYATVVLINRVEGKSVALHPAVYYLVIFLADY